MCSGRQTVISYDARVGLSQHQATETMNLLRSSLNLRGSGRPAPHSIRLAAARLLRDRLSTAKHDPNFRAIALRKRNVIQQNWIMVAIARAIARKSGSRFFEALRPELAGDDECAGKPAAF